MNWIIESMFILKKIFVFLQDPKKTLKYLEQSFWSYVILYNELTHSSDTLQYVCYNSVTVNANKIRIKYSFVNKKKKRLNS